MNFGLHERGSSSENPLHEVLAPRRALDLEILEGERQSLGGGAARRLPTTTRPRARGREGRAGLHCHWQCWASSRIQRMVQLVISPPSSAFKSPPVQYGVMMHCDHCEVACSLRVIAW